jgi:hypothetical protein
MDCEELDTEVKMAQFQNWIETKTKNNLNINPPKSKKLFNNLILK